MSVGTYEREHKFVASRSSGEVSAVARVPRDARWLFLLAHGAGAGMRHVFLESLSEALAVRKIATLRYQFPYMEQGSRRPSPRGILLSTVRAANELAEREYADLPRAAGGKSMGGRMTTGACAESALPGVRGIVLVGFPLHPAGKPSVERADHLAGVEAPMLFLQGTRDKLAELNLLEPILDDLGDRARLHVVEGADHGFHVLKRSGRTDTEVLDELASTIAEWLGSLS